eukprot:768291-Hanusia_phi.AAC.10
MSAALQKLNKSSNDQPRGHDEEVSRNSKSKEAWGGPESENLRAAEDPHGSRAAALDLLKSMKDESNLNEVVGKVSGSDWEWPVAEAFPGLKSITNEVSAVPADEEDQEVSCCRLAATASPCAAPSLGSSSWPALRSWSTLQVPSTSGASRTEGAGVGGTARARDDASAGRMGWEG